MGRLPARCLIGAFAALAGAVPASAQALDDRYWIEVSAYWPTVDSSVRIEPTGSVNPGSKIDFESDLDLNKRKVLPAVYAGARLGKRFSIAAEYYSLSRKGTTNLARDILFDGVTYPATASVDSKYNTDIYRLSLGYAFVRKENVEFGAALGLHAADFEIELDGQGKIGNTTATFQQRRKKFLAPLPTIGLFGSVEVAPQVTLGGRVDFLSLKIGDYDGRLINTQASIAYRVLKNLSIGALYRYVDYRVDVTRPKFDGRVAYQYNGPALFLQLGF